MLRRSASPTRRNARHESSSPTSRLDDETHEVWKNGELVPLSPTEFTLLRYFMVNAGTVLSKPRILDHVWNYDFGGDVNVVESYVSYLRRKIDTGEAPHPYAARRRVRHAQNPARVGRVPIPLRVSLVLLSTLLVAIGLTVSGFLVSGAMRDDLYRRVDSQLRQAVGRGHDPSTPTSPTSGAGEMQRPPSPVLRADRPGGGVMVRNNDSGFEPNVTTIEDDPADHLGPLTVAVGRP